MRILSIYMIAVLFLSTLSCQNKKEKNTESVSPKDSLTDIVDSTVVGISDDFGQSVFSIITNKGDTLILLREQANGEMAHIIGDIDSGMRYAITYETKGGELYLRTAINLSQVDLFTKAYTLANGHLVLGSDTVAVIELTDSTFIAKGHSNTEYRFKN